MKQIVIAALIVGVAVASGAEDIKVSSQIWAHYNHDFSSYDGQTNAFSVGRAYFTLQRDLDERFSASATLDLVHFLSGYSVSTEDVVVPYPVFYDTIYTAGGETLYVEAISGDSLTFEETSIATASGISRQAAFLKFAYIQWADLVPDADIRFGLILTPGVEKQTSYWGYRPIHKTPMHRVGLVKSADFGIDLHGVVSDGMFDYWAQVTNDASSFGVESDMYKRFAFRLGSEPMPGLWLHGYADYEQRAPETSVMTLDFMAGYKTKMFALSGEVFTPMFSFPNSDADFSGLGFAVYGWAKILPTLGVLARIDNYDPNTDMDDDGHMLFIGGLDFAPHEKVHFIPNVQIVTHQAEGSDSDNTAGITGVVKF